MITVVIGDHASRAERDGVVVASFENQMVWIPQKSRKLIIAVGAPHLACSTAPYVENKGVAVVNADGMTETVVENPCGIGEWLREQYKPWAGLLYGPLYLLCCSLPYWLIVVRRVSLRLRRQVGLLAVALLVIEWVSIFGECTAVFGERPFPGPYDQMRNNVDQYIWPPATIFAAFVISWVFTTQVLQRFGRRA